MIGMKIKGLDKLNQKMNKLGSSIQPMLQDTTMKAVLYVHSKVPNYPPAPAGSTYRRTLTLFRTITTLMGSYPDALSRVESLFGMVRGIVGTKLNYAGFVIDETQQTNTHKNNGWWVLQKVVLSLKSDIKKIYEQGVKSTVRGIFK